VDAAELGFHVKRLQRRLLWRPRRQHRELCTVAVYRERVEAPVEGLMAMTPSLGGYVVRLGESRLRWPDGAAMATAHSGLTPHDA
jgi:hypothetical protein